MNMLKMLEFRINYKLKLGRSLKNAEESFRQGWKEALAGETMPVSELWDDINAEKSEQGNISPEKIRCIINEFE
ncbi:hypothetical protein GMMP15_410016 [Candidatus Magnetomoraceae bacterium gMMP-15]